MRASLAFLAGALAIAACGSDGAAAETSSVTPLPVETFVPEEDSVHWEILQLGLNSTGLSVPIETWVQLAEAGCRDGAWQRPVAAALATEFLNLFDPEGNVPIGEMERVVWGVTLAGCRDHFPRAEIERGPPGGTGQ